jgi:hypothetical protein
MFKRLTECGLLGCLLDWCRRFLDQPLRDKKMRNFLCCHLMHLGSPMEVAFQLSAFSHLFNEAWPKK